MSYNNQRQSNTEENAWSGSSVGREIPAGRSHFNRTTASTGGGEQGSGSRSYQSGGGRYSRGTGSGPSSPWEGTAGFHEKPSDYVPLTEVGFEFPLKKALLARYNPNAQLPAATMARIRQNDELIRCIWSEEPLPPMSFEPFSEEERKAVASGNFCNFHAGKKPHHGQGTAGQRPLPNRRVAQGQPPAREQMREPMLQPWQSPGSTGADFEPLETNPSNDTYASQYQQQRRRPDFLEEERPKGRSLMSTMRRKELEAEKTTERILEERFTAPLNAKKNVPAKDVRHDPKMVASLSDLDDDHDHLAAWAEASEPVISSRRVETIHSDFYSHQQQQQQYQQPHRIIESARVESSRVESRVEVESAPLGGFFAQFMAASPRPIPELPEICVTAATRWLYRDPSGQIQGPFGNGKMLEWYRKAFFPDTLPLRREEDVDFVPLASWKSRCEGRAPFELSSPVIESPISKIFDLNLGSTITTTNPSNVSTSSLLSSTPSNVASPKALNAEEQRFLSQFGLFTQPSKSAEKVVEPIQAMASLKIDSSPVVSEKPAWGSVKPVQPVKLDDQPIKKEEPINNEAPIKMAEPIKKEEPRLVPASASGWVTAPSPTIAVPISSPVPAPRSPMPASSSPSAGWSKPATSPAARPLEEILKEEEARASQRPAKSGPKSFADLMKASSSTSAAAPSTAQSVPVSKPYSSPIASPVTSSVTSQSAPKAKKNVVAEQTRAWATTALSPLSSVFDVDTCVALLMDLPTADEVAAFVRANMRSDSISLAAFTHELIGRRFGSVEAGRFPAEAVEEFVTVDRRKAKK